MSTSPQQSTLPPGHLAFLLPPATSKTVVTTTTYTTLTFPPVLLPRPASPPALPEPDALARRAWGGRARWPVSQHSSVPDSRFDHKLYPLSRAPLPPDWSLRGLPVPLRDGSCARLVLGRPLCTPSAPPPAPSPPRRSPSDGPRKRLSLSKPAQLSVVRPSPSLPPRKKPRLAPTRSGSPALSDPPSSPRSPSGPPSPLPAGRSRPVPNLPVQPPSGFAHPLDAPNAHSALATVSSLPTLIADFAQLAPDLQQYVLFNLLRSSSIPVLQFVQNLVAPALRRDFVSDLPPELTVLVLSKLDGPSLCRACRVSKTWYSHIENSPAIWRHRLVAENLWVGDGSEALESEECRLIEQGVPRSSASHFARLWNTGVWRSSHHTRRTRAEDGGTLGRRTTSLSGLEAAQFRAARQHLKSSSPEQLIHVDARLGPASPTSEPRRRVHPRSLTSNPVWPIRTPNTSMSSFNTLSSPLSPKPSSILSSSQHAHHPALVNEYKLLYRKRYLMRQNWKKEPQRIAFPGHGLTVVTCLQFDWEKLVAASDDDTIHSYELRTGRRLMSFIGHKGGVWALQYVANVLVTGSTDRTVRVWDMTTGRNTHVFAGHTSTVRCLQIVEPVNTNTDPDGAPVWEPAFPLIVTGSRDHTLRVWKLPSPDDEDYLPGPSPGSPSVDEAVLSAATAANPFHLFFLKGHTHAVRALAAAGRTVVSGSYDTTVRVWDLLTGECKQQMKGHTQKVYSVVIDRLRARCASGSMDNTVRLWDLETGTTLCVMEEHSSLVGLLGFSHTKLVSAAADSTLRIWDPATGHPLSELRGHQGAITCFQHDETRVISGSDGTLKLWDAGTGKLIRDLCRGYTAVWQVGLDERFAVVAVQRGTTSEYEVLDFGRCDGRSDFEEECRLKALGHVQAPKNQVTELDMGWGEDGVVIGDEQSEMLAEENEVNDNNPSTIGPDSWSSSGGNVGAGSDLYNDDDSGSEFF